MSKMSLPMSANRVRSCRRKERRTLWAPASASLRDARAAALGYGQDELTVGQVEKEVPAEVLAQKEGPLLGAGGAKEEAFA